MKGNLNTIEYHDTLDSVLPTLWQQCGKGPFLFKHDNAPVHKVRSIQKWVVEIGVEELDSPAQSPDLNPIDTFGMNWNADCEPGLITQHQCPNSLMLLWLNGSKSLQQCFNILYIGKPSQKWRLL